MSSNKQSVVEEIVSAFKTTQNQSWSMFNDKLKNVSNKNFENKDMAKSDNSITLSSDDLPVFGLVPRLDKVMLVSCYECAMIVKRDCIHSHFHRRHNGNNVVSHSEADKFSLVNFLCTVKTNKNKKLKMTVRKTPEKKTNESENFNKTIKRIKTEFNQEEYDRLNTNIVKIKEEYVDENDVDMVTTSFKPNTSSSSVFEWDVKPCIKHEVYHTDHILDEKMIEHHEDLNKLSTVSLGIIEDLQSNKHLDIQKKGHTINYVTGSSQLMHALDPIEKIKHKINIDVSDVMSDNEEKYLKRYYNAKNKNQKLPHKIKNIKEQTELTINNDFLDIVTDTNYDDTTTSRNQWLNTSAVDVLKYDSEVPCCEIFSEFKDDGEQTKLLPYNDHLDVKNDMSTDSATNYNQSTKSPKIKEEFQILPNSMFPDVKIKEEFQILPNSMFPDVKIKEEFQILPNSMFPDVKIKEEFHILPNSMFPDVKIKEEFHILPNSMFPDVKIKEEYEEYDDKYNAELNQSQYELTECSSGNNHSKLTECLSDNNHSEVIHNTNSGNVVYNNNHLSIIPCCVTVKEEITFIESHENFDYTVPKNQLRTALLDINEESKLAFITDCMNEKSKPSLNNDLINDDFYTEYYQIYTNSIPLLSPNLKYVDDKHLNDELDLQDEDILNNEQKVQIEKNLNNQLNLNVALNLQIEEDLKNKLDLLVEDDLKNKLDLLLEDDLNNEFNLQSEEDLNDQFNMEDEESLDEEASLPDEDALSDELDWQSEDDLEDDLNSQDEKYLNVKLNLPGGNESSIELNLQSEDNLSDEDSNSDLDNLSNEDMTDEEDLNDGKNLSGAGNLIGGGYSSSGGNLSDDDLETNDGLKCDYLVPYQLPNNEKQTKVVPIKEGSIIINNESSNAASTDYDQSLAETRGDETESKAKSIADGANVIIDNHGIVNNFENEYYQTSSELYVNEAQTSFKPSYKYSDVISNESSDDSISSYDQSSVESLGISDKTDHSSSDTSLDYTSDESSCDSNSTTSSSDQSTVLQDITKNPKYAKPNFLEDHEQFTGRVSKFIKSFEFEEGKNNCTQTNEPFECKNCCTTTEDFIDTTQIDEHIDSVPNNSNVQMDGYDVSKFTPISYSAQIINNTIIPMDVEEYELKDNNDCGYVSNRSHNLSHVHTHTSNRTSQINNLTHSPINENNSKIYSSELYAYKPNKFILPFIKKNNEVHKNLMKMVGAKIVKERKCKIMPYNRTAEKFKINLKRQAADGKENLSHLITNGFKTFKMVFIDRDFSCSDESDNNVND